VNLLLDTPILLWSLLEPERLSRDVAAALEDESSTLWLSPITTWEVLILAERGRLELHREPAAWLRQVLGEIPFKEAALNHEVVIRSRGVDLSHQDPADRFLVATARVYDLTLVTADRHLLGLKDLKLLPNR